MAILTVHVSGPATTCAQVSIDITVYCNLNPGMHYNTSMPTLPEQGSQQSLRGQHPHVLQGLSGGRSTSLSHVSMYRDTSRPSSTSSFHSSLHFTSLLSYLLSDLTYSK